MKAKRIQRKRTKGWRMPPNTIYVGRGSKWGNPFSVELYGIIECVRLYRQWISDNEINITELRGKNLACWCKVGEPCHADILLELANKKAGEK